MAQETMENFIPMNKVWLCNKCKRREPGTSKCEVYPDWIPDEVLFGNNCKDFVNKKEHCYTYADVLDWDENERTELIYGEPVMMAPPSRVHQEISGELFAQLHDYLKGKRCRVYHPPFGVRLFEKDGDLPHDVDTLVEPDITVVCDPDKLDDAGCKGAPDMVVEILSPTTQRHDRLVKFNLYQKAGVREYWIVDPSSRSVSVYTLENGYYFAAAVYSETARVPVGVLDDCMIDLSAVFSNT
jgi:Uma2 family endonuclease